MSRALDALICIRLDGSGGTWVRMEQLAQYLGVTAVQVASACALLAQDRLVEVQRGPGGAIEAARTPARILGREFA